MAPLYDWIEGVAAEVLAAVPSSSLVSACQKQSTKAFTHIDLDHNAKVYVAQSVRTIQLAVSCSFTSKEVQAN